MIERAGLVIFVPVLSVIGHIVTSAVSRGLARRALGQHWKGPSPQEQQHELIRLFGR